MKTKKNLSIELLKECKKGKSINEFLLKLEHTTQVNKNELLLEEDREDIRQDRYERRVYSIRTFIFLRNYVAIIISIIVFSAFQSPYFSSFIQFNLSDNVLITLITSSLALLVSIFLVVMKYLFKK